MTGPHNDHIVLVFARCHDLSIPPDHIAEHGTALAKTTQSSGNFLAIIRAIDMLTRRRTKFLQRIAWPSREEGSNETHAFCCVCFCGSAVSRHLCQRCGRIFELRSQRRVRCYSRTQLAYWRTWWRGGKHRRAVYCSS